MLRSRGGRGARPTSRRPRGPGPTVAQLSPEIQRTKTSRDQINSVLKTTVTTMANILGKFYYITLLKHTFQTLYIL